MEVKEPHQEHLPVWAWLSILILTAVITGCMLWTSLDPSDMSGNVAPFIIKKSSTPVKTAANGWKIYENKDYGFSFEYPKDWKNIVLTKQKNTIDELPGTSIASWTKDGPTYFDPKESYVFSIDSKDFMAFEGVSYNKMKINPDWSSSDFVKNMEIKGFDVLEVKKLSDKSLLVIAYGAPECSPMIKIDVLASLNDDYPNFEIGIISAVNLEKDKLVSDYVDKQLAANKDTCDELEPYRQIAKKIINGDYGKITSQIEEAQKITDSLRLIK